MLEVTLALGALTCAAAIITLRRVVSWQFMIRRAVWFDVLVTGFALWAFSGQGVTGMLTGVFAGLCFSLTLHAMHWILAAGRAARIAATAAQNAAQDAIELPRAAWRRIDNAGRSTGRSTLRTGVAIRSGMGQRLDAINSGMGQVRAATMPSLPSLPGIAWEGASGHIYLIRWAHIMAASALVLALCAGLAAWSALPRYGSACALPGTSPYGPAAMLSASAFSRC